MPAVSGMRRKKALAIVLDEGEDIGLLLVRNIPGAFAHIENAVKVVQIPHVRAFAGRALGHQPHVRANHAEKCTGLTPKALDYGHQVRSSLMMVVARAVPFDGIGDDEEFLLSHPGVHLSSSCLLYTSDAADERSSVDLGGR